MALGKKAMMVFENLIQKGKIPMPREVIKIDQTSLFDEPGNNDEQYKKMVFHLHYIKLDENPNSDPVPKQSFKQFVMRDKMGNVKTFRNKDGKLDVFQGGYTDKKVTSTKDALVAQIKYILSTTYRGHPAFKKDVHVTRCEFIFNPLAAMTKKDEEALRSDRYIVFKTTKPDLDNLEKMLWDCMEEAGVFENDSQIASKNGIFKRYGFTSGVIVEIEGRI